MRSRRTRLRYPQRRSPFFLTLEDSAARLQETKELFSFRFEDKCSQSRAWAPAPRQGGSGEPWTMRRMSTKPYQWSARARDKGTFVVLHNFPKSNTDNNTGLLVRWLPATKPNAVLSNRQILEYRVLVHDLSMQNAYLLAQYDIGES